jgi:Cyclic-phosphate processing Receiver domain
VRTVPAAIELLKTGQVTDASLDHDLGEGDVEEGYALCLWMAEHDVWPSEAIRVHSANPPGTERMVGVIHRYGPCRAESLRGLGHRRLCAPGARYQRRSGCRRISSR